MAKSEGPSGTINQRVVSTRKQVVGAAEQLSLSLYVSAGTSRSQPSETIQLDPDLVRLDPIGSDGRQ